MAVRSGIWCRRSRRVRSVVNKGAHQPGDSQVPDAAEPVLDDGGLHVVGVADRPDVQQPALPAADEADSRPAGDRGRRGPLHARRSSSSRRSRRCCSPYFAQWFTDGFLRSDRATGQPGPAASNESNHEIDLTNLYGLHRDVTRQLRTLRGRAAQEPDASTARSTRPICARTATPSRVLADQRLALRRADRRDPQPSCSRWAATRRTSRSAS